MATKTGDTVYRDVILRNERKYTKLTEDLVSEGRRLYERFGAAYTLWWFIREVWVRRRHPVRFKDLYRFHQKVAGVKSKYATLKALNRLKEYGLVGSAYGKYYPLITDEVFVLGSIDFRQVRRRDQVVRPRGMPKTQTQVEGGGFEELPRPVKRVVRLAKQLVENGKKWEAVDLVAHTLLPVRQTGVLLAKIGDVFIFRENKTNKFHALKSPKLAKLWEDLGLPEDKLWLHVKHSARHIIRREWGGYVIARKIHYLLKELGWFQEIDKPIYYEILVDRNDNRHWVVRLMVRKAGTLEDWAYVGPAAPVFQQQLQQQQESDWWVLAQQLAQSLQVSQRFERVAAGAVVRREHVKEENEESYFSRSPGML